MKLKVRFPLVCYWVLGLIFFVSGALLLFAQSFMRSKIVELTRLVNGTEGYENWLTPKAPLTMHFYFFNITNMQEFQEGGKPVVVEVGPYVYKEARSKELDYVHDGLIGYREQKLYYFDGSNGRMEDDVLMSLNLPMMVIARLLDDRLPSWVVEMVAVLLQEEPLMLKLTVKELLWGYNATLFDLINTELHKLHLPTIPFPQFGIFSQGGGNGSQGDLMEVWNGEGGVDQVAQINKWNNQRMLPFWSGDYCNAIKGTDGSIFHPFTTPSQNLSIFSIDICRSITLTYNHSTSIHSIPTHVFTLPPETFESYHTRPENECFCVPDRLKCLKTGVMDISACKMGAPIVVSMPHFLHADQEYLDAVTGTHPSTLLHRTNIYVEPSTGIALKAEKRLQINFLLDNYPLFKASRHIKTPMVYPVMWLEESGCIDANDAGMFYDQVTLKVNLLNGIVGAFVTLGICACVVMALQGGTDFVRVILL